MFQQFFPDLEAVRRFDKVVDSKEIEIGEVQQEGGGSRLALEFPGGDVAVLEERGEAQFLGQWGVPHDHWSRLPFNLQVAELVHFTRHSPKTLTYRAVEAAGAEYPSIRSVMSSRYSPFDSRDVLRLIEPHVAGFEIARHAISRDEMVLSLTLPQEHDVSLRKVGDVVKAGLTLRNSEVGTMALGVELSLWRLACLNGMQISSSVSVHKRHIWISREEFIHELHGVIVQAADVGRSTVARLRAAHQVLLPNLDPDEGKVQREVVAVLRREAIWNQTFRENAERALGSDEEASLFGLIQFLTGSFAKSAPADVRLARERAAGRLLTLAA